MYLMSVIKGLKREIKKAPNTSGLIDRILYLLIAITPLLRGCFTFT